MHGRSCCCSQMHDLASFTVAESVEMDEGVEQLSPLESHCSQSVRVLLTGFSWDSGAHVR